MSAGADDTTITEAKRNAAIVFVLQETHKQMTLRPLIKDALDFILFEAEARLKADGK